MYNFNIQQAGSHIKSLGFSIVWTATARMHIFVQATVETATDGGISVGRPAIYYARCADVRCEHRPLSNDDFGRSLKSPPSLQTHKHTRTRWTR